MSDKRRRDRTALRRILKAVRAGQIHLYRNLRSEPYVYCDHKQYPAINVRLFDRDFGDWLYHFVHAETGLLLHQHELNRILRKLSGLSMANPIARITDKALTELLETEPTVAVVYEFMFASDKNPYEDKAEPLWKLLSDFADKRRLRRLGRRHFPRGPQVLSRKLGEPKHIDALKQLGIEVTIRRSNGCNITLRRLDAPGPEPSGQASVPKSSAAGTLPPPDAKKALLANLQQLHKERPQPPPPERHDQ